VSGQRNWYTKAMATATIDIGDLLFVEEGFRDGRPCIRGTGITIHSVVAAYLRKGSVERVAADLPHIPVAAIHAALAYFHTHRAEVEADFEADAAWGARTARELGAEIL
jgi:uncharacterized protein (DUF433 family)